MKQKFFIWAIILLGVVLRVYRLDRVPPSLYWDEASLGYNAYSIATTLRDEHGEFLPIARFIAFGDYKAPAYIYLDAVAVKFLGLNDFSVRLPSALSGGVLILLTFFLARELLLFRKNEDDLEMKLVPLFSAVFVAISPWALQFSRGAFEANLADLLSTGGILYFLRGMRLSLWRNLVFSAVLFALSLYAFNSQRVFVPLMLLALGAVFLNRLLGDWKKFFIFGAVFLIVLLPLIPHMLSREGKLRFEEVTWLNDLAPVELANERIALDKYSWWSNLVHNRRLVYAGEFMKHYSDNFKGSFLFFSGDVNPRLSIQSIGELYWWDLPLLLLGIFAVAKRRDKMSAVLLAWALLAPVPAATARETPHALRILNVLPVPQLLSAYGLWMLIDYLGRLRKQIRSAFYLAISLTVTIFLFSYLHDYYLHYPKDYALSWQYGYKQMVNYVHGVQNNYDYVSVTESYGRPYIYFLFYERFSPENYWQTVKTDRDWYGFWYVHSFDKFLFNNRIGKGRGLLVRTATEIPQGAKLLKEIDSPAGEPVFKIYSQ